MISQLRLWRRITRCRVVERCLCFQLFPTYSGKLLTSPDSSRSVAKLAYRSYFASSVMHSSLKANNSKQLKSSNEISNSVQAIETSMKNVSRVNKSTLNNLLDLIETTGHCLDDKTWLLLLRCCGNLLPDEIPSVRVELANKVWELIKCTSCQLKVDHYDALLHSYLENRYVPPLKEFLESMGHVNPTETTYLLLLELMCEAGDLKAAADVISYMKRENLAASERMFNALLKCNAKLRDAEGCKKVFETMRAAYISPSVDSFASLLEGFGEAGDINNFKTTYANATNSLVTFTETHLLNILKKTAMSMQYNIFYEVLHLLPTGKIHVTPNVINVITHLVHLGYVQEAHLLLKNLPRDSLFSMKTESQNYSNFFIEDIVKTNQTPSMIVDICKDLEDSNRNSSALLKAAEAALSFKRVEIALSVFHAMKSRSLPLRPHYFWPLLVLEATDNGEKGVFNILRHMKELGISPDSDTLRDYVFPYCSLSDPVQLVRKLQDLEFKLSLIMSPLLAMLLQLGHVQHAMEICKTFTFETDTSSLTKPLAVAYLVTNDLKTVINLIKTLLKICNRNVDVAGCFLLDAMASKRIKINTKQIVKIMQAFVKENIYISNTSADAIYNQLHRHIRELQELNINRDFVYQLVRSDVDTNTSNQLNSNMLHPREMNLEELECHLLELQSKNMNTRGVLRRLFQMYCGQGDYQNALRIEKEFETAGFEFSPGMYAAMFNAHVKNKNLKEAGNYFAALIRKFPDFRLDEYKVVDYATLLISSGKENDALRILEMFAASHKIRYPSGISKNCWKLLNTVAQKNNPNNTKEMLEHLVHLGYCSKTNVLLGPVIRSYLNCNDVHGAIREYVHCAKELHRTPLQHELMCHLVAHKEYDLLVRQVVDATTMVHGADAAFISHAAAVAEVGSSNQLRIMLMDKRLDWSLFIQRCKRFVDEGKLSALEKILTASQGLAHSYLPSIYTCILEIYSRQGDTEGALSLWSSAQEANIILDTEFLTKLASLLKSHKCDVPFTVPNVAT